MNLPRVYTCSQSWTPVPPPSPYHPSGSSQCTSPKHPVSCIEPGLAIHFLYDIIHVSMPFSQIIPPLPLQQSLKDSSIHLFLLHFKKKKKISKQFEQSFSKENMWMANKHMEKVTKSLMIREMQIKTTMRYWHTATRMTKNINIKSYEEIKQPEFSCITHGTQTLWQNVCQFLIKLSIHLSVIE